MRVCASPRGAHAGGTHWGAVLQCITKGWLCGAEFIVVMLKVCRLAGWLVGGMSEWPFMITVLRNCSDAPPF